MSEEKKYFVLAYYLFTPIENPHEEVIRHLDFFEGRDITSRIYLSEEGINGQFCGADEDAKAYMEWLKLDPRFVNIEFKVHYYHEQVFPRKTVKYRKQLVALDAEVDSSLTGTHLSPKQWSEMLESKDESTLLLDVRNDYEWEVGHFEGSELPKLETFRKFPTYAKELKEKYDPKKTKVMMCCTGGIRCELYSALLKQEGFEEVYQLQGGIIKYGLEEGSKHWRGKLFVFDDRLTVPISEQEESKTIGRCRHCELAIDIYYNCANMDCNDLFLCCASCAEKFLGCCCEECKNAPRVRKYPKGEKPKPFRRLGEQKKLFSKD